MRSEATASMRGLIQEIRLIPTEGKLRIELFGELAALIALASDEDSRIKHPRHGCKRRWLRGPETTENPWLGDAWQALQLTGV
jgi:hypothetical protein